MADNNVSRRRVLQGVAAGAAATGVAGQAAADKNNGGHVVGFEPGASTGPAKKKASSVKTELDFGARGKALAGTFPEQALESLQNNPNVRYVEADATYHALGETLPWGIDRVDADVLHSNGDTGNGADIAILDTGIDSDHPDLQANVQGGKCFTADCCGQASGAFCGTNSNTCNYAWDDDNDHGTHCAGTADAVDNTEGVIGVSTEANLYAGKVLDGCGSGSLSSIADGITWAADQGFDVASMSLGASSGDQTLKDAVQYAQSKGLLMVAAAGNDGPCTDCVGYPAAYSEVIAVSSTASDDTLSDFSSTGPEVEIAAPGTDVYSTIPGGYDTFSGTSMATPHVSGAAAQVMAGGSDASTTRQTLRDTAEDIGLASNEQGYGLLDAENAVGGGGDTDSAPSVSWVNPADGDTVSDTVTVQISASDSEDSDDSLTVDYTVDGGTARTASYNSTSGYYEDSWDSTGVSDGDHTLEAQATDSAGNVSSSSITVTTDNSTDSSTAPAIDQFAITNNSNGGWARFNVDWAVSDADGDLSQVDLTMDQNGTVDSASSSVSGSSASGATRLQDKKGSGSYDITLTVTDAAGNTTSQTKTVSA
jgi:subtilisin family serine protease